MGPFETIVEALASPRVGDRVRYSPEFLRGKPSGVGRFMPRARGVITKLRPVGRPGSPSTIFAEIAWDDDLSGETGFGRGSDFPSRVDANNLTTEGR